MLFAAGVTAENDKPSEWILAPPGDEAAGVDASAGTAGVGAGAGTSATDGWLPTPIELGRVAWFVRSHRRQVTWVVVVVSVLSCLALSAAAGWHATHGRLERLAWEFLPVALVAHVIAYLGYMSAHHEVLNRSTQRPVGWRRSAQIAVIGFGAWMVGGGFNVDHHAHLQAGFSNEESGAGVIVLGALELMVLTPAAWLCAVVLLHSRGLEASVTYPWVICVPLGILLALGVIGLQYWRPNDGSGRRPRWLRALGVGLLATLALLRNPHRGPEALGGIALYWAADIVALWAALRFASADPSTGRLVLGYGTAYVLTRRTLPFAGAIIIEVFLAIALTWIGVPLASAALAVLVYRLSDFCLTLAGALAVSSVLDRSLTFLRKEEPPAGQPVQAASAQR